MPEWIEPRVWEDLRKAGFARGPADFFSFYRFYALKDKDARILVVGLSSGEIIDVLRKTGSKSSISAFDLSGKSVRFTGKKARVLGLDVSLAKATALQMPFKDGSFDQVILTDFLLDNLGGEDPAVAAISEAFRVLRRGGSFVTVTSNMTSRIVQTLTGLMVNSLGLATLPHVWAGAKELFGSAMDANARGDSVTALILGVAGTGMICAPVAIVSYLARRAAGVSAKGKLLDYPHPTLASSAYFLACLLLSMKNFDGSAEEHWKRASEFSRYQRMQEKNYTTYQKSFLNEIIKKAGGERLYFETLSSRTALGRFSALAVAATKK